MAKAKTEERPDLLHLDLSKIPKAERHDPTNVFSHHWVLPTSESGFVSDNDGWTAQFGVTGEQRILICDGCDHPPIIDARVPDPDNPLPVPPDPSMPEPAEFVPEDLLEYAPEDDPEREAAFQAAMDRVLAVGTTIPEVVPPEPEETPDGSDA